MGILCPGQERPALSEVVAVATAAELGCLGEFEGQHVVVLEYAIGLVEATLVQICLKLVL